MRIINRNKSFYRALYRPILVLFAATLFSYSCGRDEQQTEFEESSAAQDGRFAPVKQARQSQSLSLVEIPITVEQYQDQNELTLTDDGFFLTAKAAATSYKLSVANCLSGYSQTGVTASTVKVYEFDSACTAQLTEIVFDGVTYDLTHADAVAWSGTGVGATATMVDTTATAGASNSTDREQLEVIIDATFTATVQSADVLTFSFRQVVKESDVTLAVSVVDDDGHTVTVSGNEAPNFTLSTTTLRGLGAGGEAQFEFELTCANAITGSSFVDYKCDDVLLADIQYTLVLDTFSGTMTRADLDEARDDTGATYDAGAIAVLTGDVFATGNGGFKTLGTGGTTYISATDAAATNIHTDVNLILILEANDSYQYFNVDVTPVSN